MARTPEVWFMKYLRTTVTMFSDDRAVDEFYDGYFVRQAFQLRKDPTRELAQYLTPDEAERIGHELIEQARQARERTAAHESVTKRGGSNGLQS